MSVVLRVLWYVLLIMIPIVIIMCAVIVFYHQLEARFPAEFNPNDICGLETKDYQDWVMFSNLPLAVRILVLPYFGGILVLLILIIKKARLLFNNFKNDLVFSKNNVQIISRMSRLIIVFSLFTFSLSTLLVSVVLLLLCEIIKNGTVLQEEQELTI